MAHFGIRHFVLGSGAGSVDCDIALIIGPHRVGPDIGARQLAVQISRPGFDAAMLRIAGHLVAQHRQNWLMNRILSDRGRLMAAYIALDLYYTDPLRRGFTVGQLREEAARHGFASRGRMTAWLASLRLLGLLADAAPGRPRRLRPTAKFLLIVRTRMDDFYQSIALFHPPALSVGAVLHQDQFVADIVAGFTEPFRAGQRILDATPELAGMSENDAGIVVLMSIMLKDAAGEAITIADLARESTVSRAHVRAVLRQAAVLGLVVWVDGEACAARPPLAEVMQRFFAALFLAHIYALDRALDRLGG